MQFRLKNEAAVPSPALLVDMDAVDENLREMVRLAGGPALLRPHVKTHKLPQIIEAQVALGIGKFKCATIAEAEMTAAAGGRDVFLAMPPVGPNVWRFMELVRLFPGVKWLTLADDAGILTELAAAAQSAGVTLEVLLDLNVGQNRTGVRPGPEAVALYRMLCETPGLAAGGLHAYDGHIHESGLPARTAQCEEAWTQVEAMRSQIAAAGLPAPRRIVAGGTPTFSIHARRNGVECSPGTCVLWDAGYAQKLPDLKFRHAAILLTRVISRPAHNRICLDLGHKSVASEMPHPRVVFPSLHNAVPVMHNEEHLVLEVPDAGRLPPGSVIYGIPWHVCPTVALHSECHAVRRGEAFDVWPVTARARRITV